MRLKGSAFILEHQRGWQWQAGGPQLCFHQSHGRSVIVIRSGAIPCTIETGISTPAFWRKARITASPGRTPVNMNVPSYVVGADTTF